MKKRVLSALLSIVMVFSLLPQGIAFAVDGSDSPTVSVDSTSALAGDTVNLAVRISNNPGILGATLTVSFDSELTLTSAKAGDAFGALTLTKPGKFTSPCNFVWDGQEINPEDIQDGIILTLSFKVAESAAAEKKLKINISCKESNITNTNLQPVHVEMVGGVITVVDYTPGDVDGDQIVNTTDVIKLRRHLAGGYDNLSINEDAANVNADVYVNTTDVITIRRFLAGGYTFPDGSPLKLLPAPKNCNHSLEMFSAHDATCTETGNHMYWRCTNCGKFFSNAEGTTEISPEIVVIPATGHTIVIDPAVPATYESKGLTEGSHCSVCHEVFVAQEEYGPLAADTANITYKLVNASKDPYLAQQTILNSNPSTYRIGEGLTLSNDLSVDGYTFVGWFDSFDDSAAQIKEIPATSQKNVTVYAHWKENPYTITYNLYQTPVTSAPTDEQKTYTVSKGNSNLYNPEINNYKFLGWYDANGTEYKTIPVGTTGNIVLNAYYTSLRNLAVSKNDNNPIIVEDRNNNVVYFTYEIGEIRNIPLPTKEYGKAFWEIQNVAGLSQQVSETYSTTISETATDSISKSVSDMTVNSNTWTLAETWNNVITNNESCSQSHEEERQDCRTEATTSSGTISISDQSGGSSYHKTEDGSTVYDYDSKTETKDKGHQFNASLNGTYSNKLSANIGASNEYGTEGSFSASNAYTQEGKATANNWSASGSQTGSQSGSSSVSDKDKYSAGISYENGYEISAGLSYGYHNNTNTVTKTGSDSVTVNSNIDENTSSWNSSATFSATNARSTSKTVRNTMSDIITTTKSYGTSYSNGGSDSATQGFSSTASNTSGTTSTVTFSKIEGKTKTTTYKVDGKIEGKYRCVLAGTAHVFGVVGYDYNTKSYFTYTFSVMDDKTEAFLDYTPKGGDFTDCENSCLPFEIPIDVFEYVNDRTAKTSGIQFTTNSTKGTAKITGYTGTDTDVVIPAYVSDGKQAYKVTEIASSAFAGKPVRAVVLGQFIQSIPAGAFKNCTNLEAVIGSFTEIGDEAFAGCVQLANMNIPSNVVKIGNDAFRGVNSINVRAINSLSAYAEAAKDLPNGSDAEIEEKQKKITEEFIDSVLNSGAQNITIDISKTVEGAQLTFDVPEINSIEVNGGLRTYNNFVLKSNASKTALNEIKIRNTNTIPLTVDSDQLTLHKVFVSGNATALILKKDGAVLSLNQDSTIESASQYAVVSKNPEVKAETAVGGATGSLDIIGNFGYVNSVQGDWNMEITNGILKEMTDEEFENYVRGAFTLTFDVNGGKTLSESEKTKTVYYGNTYGTLPIPTRDYYTFDGWYTDASGGREVVGTDVFTGGSNVTLYAHWTARNYTVSWLNPANITIQVDRTVSPTGLGNIGTLKSGSVIYHGDELRIKYVVDTGYSLASKGKESVTVSGNIGSGDIYATASPNSYTYSIRYRSTNGTDLGSSSATYRYGTTNAIYAPSKAGYNTPEPQNIKWDTTEKTITFTYSPSSVAYSTKSNRFCDSPVMTYNATVQYQNRTANSVQLRVVWTTSISAYGYNVYGQNFRASSGSAATGDVMVAAFNTWGNSVSYERSSTGSSGWITVPVGTTNATSVSLDVYYFQTNSNYTDMTAYYGAEGISETWSISLPAY